MEKNFKSNLFKNMTSIKVRYLDEATLNEIKMLLSPIENKGKTL